MPRARIAAVLVVFAVLVRSTLVPMSLRSTDMLVSSMTANCLAAVVTTKKASHDVQTRVALASSSEDHPIVVVPANHRRLHNRRFPVSAVDWNDDAQKGGLLPGRVRSGVSLRAGACT